MALATEQRNWAESRIGEHRSFPVNGTLENFRMDVEDEKLALFDLVTPTGNLLWKVRVPDELPSGWVESYESKDFSVVLDGEIESWTENEDGTVSFRIGNGDQGYVSFSEPPPLTQAQIDAQNQQAEQAAAEVAAKNAAAEEAAQAQVNAEIEEWWSALDARILALSTNVAKEVMAGRPAPTQPPANAPLPPAAPSNPRKPT